MSVQAEKGYSSKELKPTTWPDFESLFAKHNGVWGGCWCMFYHTKGEFLTKGHGPANKKSKKALVKKGRTHGIIVYSGKTPVGWVQYGPKPELPRLDASKTYQSVSLDSKEKKLWRITCFFVDRETRKRGVAGFGLNAALTSIKKKGGGLIEAYPSTKPDKGSSLMWSGTVSMFENAGFEMASQLGKSSVVMRKTV
jgi:acetyltransferase (GNAT) family protein